ncbi:MAG: ATP-binding cassette domain-containing protein [Chloroflexi bacterium]|nr:ATP-binding cassette domain-containing protein [Chloroflexota bacterium]
MDRIQVDNLVRRYGARVAVDGVTFGVGEGELFGFLGPNGAGKSTTINMLCTLLRPTTGRASVCGYDIVRQASQVRRSIGIVFQTPSLDERLSASENLELHARIYNMPRSVWAGRREQLLRLVELWDRRNDLVGTLSAGMRRRVEVARGLLHHPKVLFLDEPTAGLDPVSRERLWSYLLELRAREGVTLFLTTHYLDEADRCDRVAIVDHGRITALDAPECLKGLVGGDLVTIEAADVHVAAANLRARFGLQPIHEHGNLVVEVAAGAQLIPRLVMELGVPIQAISVRRPTLDHVFLRLTGNSIHSGMAGPTALVTRGQPAGSRAG